MHKTMPGCEFPGPGEHSKLKQTGEPMQSFDTIYQAVIEGDLPTVREGVDVALQAGLPAGQILQHGLIDALAEVGRQFEAGDLYVPEMLISARAMQSALEMLKPHLFESGVQAFGRVAIGTVKGDLHDIGKNLVAMMFQGAGFEVEDLGVDASPEAFVEAVRNGAQLIGMSALLTTTMGKMEATIQALEQVGLRGQVRVMVGGAPVTQEFANRIGADAYAPDASSAMRVARSLVNQMAIDNS
jgi:5-methyltetrahydrofolate--homocysteine methyltransferase